MRIVAFAIASLVCVTGCSRFAMIDTVTSSAYRPSNEPKTMRGYQLVAGDMHCHVRPPDADWHVDRELPETLALAEQEGLDFVVLTPHVRARFFERPGERAWVESAFASLRNRVSSARSRVIAIPGFEYTDYAWGHATGAFGDMLAALGEVPLEQASEHPERFFERFVATGGLLSINHPVLTPIGGPFEATRADLSWRAFFDAGPHPPEIDAIDRYAVGVEVFNLGVTHMRDGLLLGDPDRSLRHASVLADRMSRARGVPIAALGGTDSHSHHLRAVTFVLAREVTARSIREAITEGRTCVRDRAACGLEASADGATWVGIGETLSAPGGVVRVRAPSDDATYYVNGVPQRGPDLNVSACACSVVRARVGMGWSSGIRVNCKAAEVDRRDRSPG